VSELRRLRDRPGALLFVWAFQLAGAMLAAGPIVGALSRTGIADHPAGDAILFEPGGLLLVEALRLGGPALLGALGASGFSLLLLHAAALVPLAALLVALATPGKLNTPLWLGRAAAHFPAFLLLAGVTWLARALLLVASLFLLAPIGGWLDSAVNERNADLALLAGVLVVFILLILLGIAQDLGRAAVVRHGSRALGSLVTGLAALRRRPLAALAGWLTPASWSVALIAGAAIVTGWLAVDQPGSWRVLAVLVVHQAALLGLLLLRALWLRTALGLVGRRDSDLT
jgi:hypothetical protein